MADAVTSQIYDGARNVVAKFTNISDGTGESNVVKIDASTLNPDPGTSLRITRIIFDVNQGTNDSGGTPVPDATVELKWVANTPVTIAVLSGYGDTIELEQGPGITNNAGAGANGDISFTTHNFTTGCSYTVILYMKKN